MKSLLRRVDTLFVRLFLLMWVVLIISHVVAFGSVMSLLPGQPAATVAEHILRGPAVPSLPPVGPRADADRPGPPPADLGPAGMPGQGPGMGPGPGFAGGPGDGPGRRLVLLDYTLRALFIGLGAWLGARWLSAPMRRLARAAQELPQGLEQGRQAAPLDDVHGTLEVRETARVFNRMAQRLQHQFDQRSLHMAAVSHDLRTPLTRLRLRLEKLPAEVTHGAVADLHEMDELIETSLEVMREQSGGSEAAAVDLGALLQSLVDDLAELGQAIELREPLPPVRVRAHPASLRRIVDNLVGNALRYGRKAQVGLEVSESVVRVVVDDNGPGIPPERLERVFEPWVRGAHRPGGNGLGLAIARDLARREGGDVQLANRAEGGLRATLSLPLGLLPRRSDS